jgi:ATP-binding cassette, subfamily B, bacterial
MQTAAQPDTQSTTLFVLKLLGTAVVRYRRRTLAAFGLIILAKLATVAVPLSLKGLIDQLSQPQALLALPVFLLLAYALLRFLGTLFGEIRDLVFARVTQRTVSGFLLQAFEQLHALSVRFHATRRTGGVTRDVERGTAGIAFLLGVGLFTIIPTMIEIIAVVAIMTLNYSNWFTAIILVTFVVYTSFTVIFTARREIFQRALNELDSSANSRLVDSLLNYETVKYYTNERFEHRRFSGILDQWVDVGVNNQKALFMLHIGQSGIIALGVAAIMLLAAQSVVRGVMTVGDLVLVNAYVIQVCLPLNSLGFVFRQARDAIVNAEKLFRLLEQKPEIQDAPGVPDLHVTRGEVGFEHVEFGYESKRTILWDVSFSIPPGGTVAVVGGSGSGKSTLARLLFRFYDPVSGKVSIDDQDIRTVSQKSLRAAVGIVPQDTILFNDTIAYNIGYGREGATLADIIDAARAAHVHDFISALPEQYDTEVGERGVKLSGGEKQRIAIARALLKNPPIMIFDEATSALDTRSERAIQEELDRLAKERTTLIIAHRLSTIVDADEILVLEQGRVVERGTHPALLQKDGVYAKMWRLQRQEQELEQTKQKLSVQPVNLLALLAGIVDGLKPLIDERSMSFYSTITTESARIVGDPGSLQQAIWSLAVRAIAAAPIGGRVELRVERRLPDGLTPEEAQQIVVTLLHNQAENAAPPVQQEGETPLLEIAEVEDILAHHGGSLSQRRNPDGTACMSMSLPLRRQRALPAPKPAEQGGATPAPPAGPEPSITGVGVLIVDDTADTREELEATLRRRGALCRAFASGHEALEWLGPLPEEEWPDVMICDIMLDDEDGHEVIQRLRHLEAERHFSLDERLPAISLSSQMRTGEHMRALMAGFQMQLGKPVVIEELVAGIAVLAGARNASSSTVLRSSAS